MKAWLANSVPKLVTIWHSNSITRVGCEKQRSIVDLNDKRLYDDTTAATDAAVVLVHLLDAEDDGE